jgi:hypothetical protein
MNIGILILFHNDEKEIKIPEFIHLFTKKVNLEICFINNGSTDKTLEMLTEIQEEATVPISIIDVKKDRGHHAAIKAGVRYLSSKKELPYILCLKNYTSQDFKMLEKTFQLLKQGKSVIVSLFKKSKRMVHKNVFSLHGVLGKVS